MLAQFTEMDKPYVMLILGIGAFFVIIISAAIIHAITIAFKHRRKPKSDESAPSAWEESAKRVDTSRIPEDPNELLRD